MRVNEGDKARDLLGVCMHDMPECILMIAYRLDVLTGLGRP